MNPIRLITVRGDIDSTGLWDAITFEQIRPEDLHLPESFILRLRQLVKDYDPLIPLPERELLKPGWQAQIKAIDSYGVRLTEELSGLLGKGFKLRYYSEGLRKFID